MVEVALALNSHNSTNCSEDGSLQQIQWNYELNTLTVMRLIKLLTNNSKLCNSKLILYLVQFKKGLTLVFLVCQLRSISVKN